MPSAESQSRSKSHPSFKGELPCVRHISNCGIQESKKGGREDNSMRRVDKKLLRLHLLSGNQNAVQGMPLYEAMK